MSKWADAKMGKWTNIDGIGNCFISLGTDSVDKVVFRKDIGRLFGTINLNEDNAECWHDMVEPFLKREVIENWKAGT